MTKFVQMYYEYTENNLIYLLTCKSIIMSQIIFGDSTQPSPQREHGHSHYMFVSNIYRHGGCFPYTHQFLLIG